MRQPVTKMMIIFAAAAMAIDGAFPQFVSWGDIGFDAATFTRFPRPVVINTWPWTGATAAAWRQINLPTREGNAVDAVVVGCSAAEADRSIPTVGAGGSPDESGNTTLDAMVMDGYYMEVGAVAGMPFIKEAAQVARAVLRSTRHTLLVGESATNFATSLGFNRTDLSSNESISQWKKWRSMNCQPNFRLPKSWTPDTKSSCGPYRYINGSQLDTEIVRPELGIDENNHDTIGMIALDKRGGLAVGLSSNGARFRIPGRVGDSPIPGAGGYADSKIGAAVATGDGDVMMRYLLTFRAVDLMKQGKNATEACRMSLQTVRQKGTWYGGLVALRADGQYGAACVGFKDFAFSMQNSNTAEGPRVVKVTCQPPPTFDA